MFIVGAPRSGTGILQNLLRVAPTFAWVTPATNAMTGFAAERDLPVGLGFTLARPLDVFTKHVPARWRPKFLEGPFDGLLEEDPRVPADEGSRIWVWHIPDRDHDRLTADDVTEEAREFYQEVAKRHRSYFSAPTFLSKRPSNSLRLPFLEEIFPEARFIHLTRDPRAVGSSILRRARSGQRDWWGARPPGWSDQLDRPVGSQVGWQIREIVETLRQDAADRKLGDRFVEVSYEALTGSPEDTIPALFETLGLDRAHAGPLCPYFDQLENRNEGWDEPLSDAEIEDLLEEVEDLHAAERLPEGAVRI